MKDEEHFGELLFGSDESWPATYSDVRYAKPARRRNFSVFFDTCRECGPSITPDRRSALTY
jgi:hypothetical protein